MGLRASISRSRNHAEQAFQHPAWVEKHAHFANLSWRGRVDYSGSAETRRLTGGNVRSVNAEGQASMPSTVRLHRVLTTSPEKVYRAFLEADALARISHRSHVHRR